MVHEEGKESQEHQPQQELNTESGQSVQPSTETNAESPTSIAPSIGETGFPRTPSASPLVLGNDLLSSLPSTSRPRSPSENLGRESDTMFSGDLDVQSNFNAEDHQQPVVLDATSSDTTTNDQPSSKNNAPSVSNVLPDILGENSFTSVKADLLAKMKKIDGLILNAQQIQTKYQGVDSDSLRSIEDMLHKLYSQKVDLQNELALLLTVNDKVTGPPEQSTSGRQSSAEAPLSRPQPSLPTKIAPTVSQPTAAATPSSQKMDLAKSIGDLTNNLRDITKQKIDLEKMVQILHVRKSQAQSKEEAEHFSILIHRHEVQVKELDRTVNDAGKTLITMKQIHAQLSGAGEDQENEEAAVPDPNLHALRSRLQQMRTRLDDITQEEQQQSSSSTLHENTAPHGSYDNQRGFRILAGRHDQDSLGQYQPHSQKISHQQQPQSQRGFRLQSADLMFPADGLNQRRDLNNTGKIQADNRDGNERHYNRFVIDNIHSGQHPPLMDDQRPYSYVPLNDQPSSDSEAEHAAEMKLQQLEAMYSNTTPKKNLNSRSWKNAAGSSRTGEEGSAGGPNDIMPEMLNSLQTMISEQQKMLNHCASFVSKQQSGQSPVPDSGAGSSMQRSDRDRIPFINNTLRESSYYPYNIPPPSGRHRAKPRRDNAGYATAGGLLNNQRNDARMSSVSPNIGDYAHSSDYCDNRDTRQQNRADSSRADQAAPIRVLMERILHEYENDLGSLHYMLDCLSAVRTKQGRAGVAAQLGMAVAMECAKEDNKQTRNSFPPPSRSAFEMERDRQNLLPVTRSYPGILSERPNLVRPQPSRQRLTEEFRRGAQPLINSLGGGAPDLVGSGSRRLTEAGRNAYPSAYDERNMAQGDSYGGPGSFRFRQGTNNGSLLDQVQQRVQQIRAEDGTCLPQGSSSYPFANSSSMTQSEELVSNAIRMGLPRNNIPQGGATSYLSSNNGALTSDEYCDPHSGASGASADYDMVRDFGQNM